MVRFWQAALLVLLAGILSMGCGNSEGGSSLNEDNVFVTGGGSAVSVRIVGTQARTARFSDAVRRFRLSVYSTSAQLLGSQTQERNFRDGEQSLSVTGIPNGSVRILVEALDDTDRTLSFYSSANSVPLAEGQVVIQQNQFVTGAAPSPTPVTSPTPVPSPQVASPTPAPSASPIPSPTPTPSPTATPTPTPIPSPSAFPSPVPPASPSPGSSPTTSPTTQGSGSFTMQSDQGDYIGGGKTWSYQSGRNINRYSASIVGTNRSFVRLSLDGTNGATGSLTDFWGMDFRAVGNNTLVPGTYTGARRASFTPPDRPGLDVSGDGRGSNTLYGDFTVYECTFDNTTNRVIRFSADFIQYSEKDRATGPALRGQVRFSIP